MSQANQNPGNSLLFETMIVWHGMVHLWKSNMVILLVTRVFSRYVTVIKSYLMGARREYTDGEACVCQLSGKTC